MKIVLTPDWFLGKDVLVEGFSFIILLVFFILAIRYYRIDKKKNILYLGIGFLIIALAQLATIFTKLVLYYDTTFIRQIGQMIITYNVVKSVDIFYYVGFFFHRLLTLVGFYIIYKLERKMTMVDFILAIYFTIISVIALSSFYYIFHITALVLLILITNNYYKVYKKTKFVNTIILILAFGLLSLSHLIFILSKLDVMYVTANIIELVSYIILLVLIIKIIYKK